MPIETITHQGLAAVRFRLATGDTVIASLHGGQVLSWVPGEGGERLFVSDKQVFGANAAIRGGVPVCFPQFNQRGSLPKHGFARRAQWALASPADAPEDGFDLLLREGAATHAIWPERFELRLRVTLAPQTLKLTLKVHNPGSRAWPFTAALHSYWHAYDVTQLRLDGLAGAACWDARDDRRFVQEGALHLDQLAPSGLDRVYTVAAPGREPGPLTLVHEPGPCLTLTQSASLSETVVWNPGQAESARLADMPQGGWRHMLCVEAARIDSPVVLEPGQTWTGWQQARFEA